LYMLVSMRHRAFILSSFRSRDIENIKEWIITSRQQRIVCLKANSLLFSHLRQQAFLAYSDVFLLVFRYILKWNYLPECCVYHQNLNLRQSIVTTHLFLFSVFILRKLSNFVWNTRCCL
jgi:hypothetical protein